MGDWPLRVRAGLGSFSCLGRAFLDTVVFERDIIGDGGGDGAPQGQVGLACCSCPSGVCRGFHLTFREAPADDDGICRGCDWIVYSIQLLACFACSWCSRNLVWEPLARWHMGPDEPTAAQKLRREKFSQSMTSAFTHVVYGMAAWRIMRRKEWLWPSERWSDGSDDGTTVAIDADLKFFYLSYAARYTSDLLSLTFYEHPRSDFWAYFIHHLTTILAVFGSAVYGYTRIGGVVMFFLDWADPPLLIAKACKYLSRDPADMYQFCADRLFELFAVVFVLTRNIIFPFMVWRAMHDFPNTTPALVLKISLTVLAAVMIFWLRLIIRAALHKMRNDGVEDIRSKHGDSSARTCDSNRWQQNAAKPKSL